MNLNCCLILKPHAPRSLRQHTLKWWSSKQKHSTWQLWLFLVPTHGDLFSNTGRENLKRNHKSGNGSTREVFSVGASFQCSPLRELCTAITHRMKTWKTLTHIFSCNPYFIFQFLCKSWPMCHVRVSQKLFLSCNKFWFPNLGLGSPKYYKYISWRRRKGWNRCNFAVYSFKSILIKL